jgi:hypothetical protein
VRCSNINRKPVPEGHKKKAQRDAAHATATKKAQTDAQAAAKALKATWLKVGQEVYDSYNHRQEEQVNKKREVIKYALHL